MKILRDKKFWIEYFKNPLCLIGTILVATMSFCILIVPIFYSQSPTDQRVWIGAKKPGYSHPAVQQETTFEVGKESNLSHAVKDNQVTYHVLEENYTNLRIVTNNSGRITRVNEGSTSLTEINAQNFQKIYRVLPNQKRIKVEFDFIIKRNEQIPSAFGQLENNVLILAALANTESKNIDIKFKNSLVHEILLDQTPTEKLSIKGENVTMISIDGKEKTERHLLGTDELGRDLLARVLYGGRISLMVGVVATIVSIFIGVIYGAVSAFYGGNLDRFMMSTVDILYAIPFMFLVIILMVSFGNNLILLFVALGAVQWLTMARIVRGQVLSLKEMEYVEAARMCGASNFQIIFKHLIPHTIGPVIVYTSLTVPVVILEESFLSFIGLQVQFQGQSLDSWGTLIDQGIKALGEKGERSWLLLWPSLAMAITLFGLNALGDGLRDILDPKMKKRNA